MRYFIVFYQAQNNSKSFHDEVNLVQEQYPTKTDFEDMVDAWLNESTGADEYSVNITNIIELNETDYNNWIK